MGRHERHGSDSGRSGRTTRAPPRTGAGTGSRASSTIFGSPVEPDVRKARTMSRSAGSDGSKPSAPGFRDGDLAGCRRLPGRRERGLSGSEMSELGRLVAERRVEQQRVPAALPQTDERGHDEGRRAGADRHPRRAGRRGRRDVAGEREQAIDGPRLPVVLEEDAVSGPAEGLRQGMVGGPIHRCVVHPRANARGRIASARPAGCLCSSLAMIRAQVV